MLSVITKGAPYRVVRHSPTATGRPAQDRLLVTRSGLPSRRGCVFTCAIGYAANIFRSRQEPELLAYFYDPGGNISAEQLQQLLIADDDADLVAAYVLFFETRGYRIHTAY